MSKNQYFVPGDGIDREVITADITRYLGNDALVRPGYHAGRTGYFITAYRNLTTVSVHKSCALFGKAGRLTAAS